MKKRSPNKKRAFVREYLKDQNGKQAAIRAGYSRKSAKQIASENLTKPDVRAAIKEKMQVLEERALVTKEYVIKGFKEIAERCRQAEPVMEFDYDSKQMVEKKVLAKDERTGEMKLVGIYKFDANGANKALECLGKSLGLFTEKHELKLGFKLEDLVAGSQNEKDDE